MNREKLIEKLKNNLSQFRYNSVEEATLFTVIGYKNCRLLMSDGKWAPNLVDGVFHPTTVYQINPDYQPEPEPEVQLKIGGLYVMKNKFPKELPRLAFYQGEIGDGNCFKVESGTFSVNIKHYTFKEVVTKEVLSDE